MPKTIDNPFIKPKPTSIHMGGGIGFGGLLTLLLIALKLTGYINWSWLWVLSPLWLPVAALFAIACVFVFLAGLCQVLIHMLDGK